jgi:hypothetical protein
LHVNLSVLKQTFMKNTHPQQVGFFAVFCFLSLFSSTIFAQVGIGNTNPAESSILDIRDNNNDKGILIPRVDILDLTTKAPISTPTIAESLLVFNTNTTTGKGFYYWNGTLWVQLSAAVPTGDNWSLLGNATTNPGTAAGQNYLGTTDAQDLVIATQGTERMRVLANGKIAVNKNPYQTPFPYDLFVAYGEADATAIRGYAGSGASIGVWGENELGGRGVNGTSRTDTGIGVFGSNGNGNGVGVQGVAFDNGIGVQGMVNSSSTGYAVFATGNTGSSGTKSFVIDDPRDPANKILKHFSIESNEVLNIYRGTEVFGTNGSVVVELPGYYDAINKNASYQLTPVGASMPNLYIEREAMDGTFIIGGGIAGKKVSWTLTAERNDPYLQQYPENRKTELDKGKKRGSYLMPGLYGQPMKKSF